MRAAVLAILALANSCCDTGTLIAADAPAIVIPGKAGVPVVINGFDASYTVVEGDWGLDRPGYVPATIVSGPLILPERVYPRGYFPAAGRRPGYGRREIEPPANRRLPPPAEDYHRFWGASSDPLPADLSPAASASMVVEPQVNTGRPPHRRRIERPSARAPKSARGPKAAQRAEHHQE